MIVRRQLSRLDPSAGGAAMPEPTPHRVAGRDGYRVELERESLRLDLFATSPGSLFIVLTVVQGGSERPAQRAEELATGLQLID